MIVGTVVRALGKVPEDARFHHAVASEADFAFDLIAPLIEVVTVARRVEVAGLMEDAELEIARATGRGLNDVGLPERALPVAAVLVNRQLGALNDQH